MKKLLFISALIFIPLVLLPSCKKDDSPPVETPELFQLVDNGTSYSTWHLVKQHSNGFIAAGAPISLTSGYAIGIADTLGPGTYSFGPIAPVQLTKTENSGSVNYTSQSGSMTIATHDTTTHFIEGTFSGVIAVAGTSQTRTITDGAFRFKY